MKIIGIIPVRYGSIRFPGKPLVKIKDKPMMQWVYEAASKSKFLDEVIVATDDKKIFNCAETFGAKVVMTPECNSGTDRLAFVVKKINCDIIVNIQGDEPLIKPKIIDAAIKPLIKNKSIQVATVATDFENGKGKANPNNVKVILNKNNFAIYFSRLPLPNSLKHIGLYVYKKNFLLKFAQMKQTPLELAEKLEQLRILENGYKIYVVKTKYKTIGVDTKSDLEKVKKWLSLGSKFSRHARATTLLPSLCSSLLKA
ncbi:MAG: 3-deoxy-manno-octulosonate cytidylyltransferase [Elusimicrobia bacterium CG06_land_8_20_14_3_00_38_11]|nr:MAG: 3-deoxy-manno-octulosonate cytidylyltransferase [Elusimicrobia bacterium CG06_land_8_20_14_3_00_38_11]